jgi:hypothetical protein
VDLKSSSFMGRDVLKVFRRSYSPPLPGIVPAPPTGAFDKMDATGEGEEGSPLILFKHEDILTDEHSAVGGGSYDVILALKITK